MSKEIDYPLQKHTLNLRAGDYAKLDELFPQLRAGPALRQIIAKFIDKHYGKEPKE